jgi:hypothetical protein
LRKLGDLLGKFKDKIDEMYKRLLGSDMKIIWDICPHPLIRYM